LKFEFFYVSRCVTVTVTLDTVVGLTLWLRG